MTREGSCCYCGKCPEILPFSKRCNAGALYIVTVAGDAEEGVKSVVLRSGRGVWQEQEVFCRPTQMVHKT